MAELDSMLTLAAISYCGYNLTLPEPIESAHLRNAMTKLLNTLSSVKGQWSVVLGPCHLQCRITRIRRRGDVRCPQAAVGPEAADLRGRFD